MFGTIRRFAGAPLRAGKRLTSVTCATASTAISRCREPWRYQETLPAIDARYWLAILITGVVATAGGELLSLWLGGIYRLPAEAAVFLGILYLEKNSARFGEALYWAAVVTAQIAATNLADLGLGYGTAAHAFSTALLLSVLWPARTGQPAPEADRGSRLPIVNTRYWRSIFAASALGTSVGDYIEHGWGALNAAAALTIFCALAILFLKRMGKLGNEVFYWLALVLGLTAGTAIADFVAGTDNGGLGLGTRNVAWYATLALTALLVGYRQGRLIRLADLRSLFAARRAKVEEGDDRFWTCAILAAAGAHMLIKWGYTWLSPGQASWITAHIKPYIFGYEITASWWYYTWLLPFIIPTLAATLVWSKVSVRGKAVVYWLTLFLTIATADAAAEFERYVGQNGVIPPYILPVAVASVLMVMVSITYGHRTCTFADAILKKNASLVHSGLVFVATLAGISSSEHLRLWINLGFGESVLLFAAVVFAVLRWRRNLSQQMEYARECMIWLACALFAYVGICLSEIVETEAFHYHMDTGDCQRWLAVFFGVLLLAAVRFWRQEMLWQDLVLWLYARARDGLALLVEFRRPLFALVIISIGLGTIYFGKAVVVPLQPKQIVLYNRALLSLRNDLERAKNWGAFKEPEIPSLQQSLQYLEHQSLEAGLIERLLYGAPDTALAAQANLKIGVILLYNAGDDAKLVEEAKGYLEIACAMNPGIPYARDLFDHYEGSADEVNRLALMALPCQRDLEMLYVHNPQSRTKKPAEGEDGQGQGQNGKPEGDAEGQPNQPNDESGEPNGKPDDQPGQTSKGDPRHQNPNDVNGGVGNDGY